MIEFQLEDTISDTDALKLIQSSNDENKLKESQNISQSMNTLILDDEKQIDPFTYKLVNSEVTHNYHW